MPLLDSERTTICEHFARLVYLAESEYVRRKLGTEAERVVGATS